MPPSIPAKSQKEVLQISEFFKNIKPVKPVDITSTKSYVQASKQSYANNTLEVIKIKDIFPALDAQKVDQIHKIVNGSLKPKPQIQMTTKVSSSQIVDLAFLYFIFHFYFHAVLFFYFSIFRTTRVKVDQSHCHISHNLMV